MFFESYSGKRRHGDDHSTSLVFYQSPIQQIFYGEDMENPRDQSQRERTPPPMSPSPRATRAYNVLYYL